MLARTIPANICLGEDVLKISWRRLKDLLSVTFFVFQDVFFKKMKNWYTWKTSWKMKNCFTEDVFKTSWKKRNVCWGTSLSAWKKPVIRIHVELYFFIWFHSISKKYPKKRQLSTSFSSLFSFHTFSVPQDFHFGHVSLLIQFYHGDMILRF